MSAAKAEELGITPLGQLVGYGMVAGPDNSLLTQPSRAIVKAAGKAGVDVASIDLFEINEAFAAVGPRLGRRPGHRRGQDQRQWRRHFAWVTRSACRAPGSR